MNDKSKNFNPGEIINQDLKETIAQEKLVKDMIKTKFEAMEVYSTENSELLSYRLSEIMVLSKRLYLELLPELASADVKEPDAVWGNISGVRMHLLHVRDCIEDFEAGMLELMEDEKKENLLDI